MEVLIIVGLYMIAILGMITHFLKKKIRGESFVNIRNYFKNHVKSTLIAIIATTIGFVAYANTFTVDGVKDVLIVFGLGYMFDSFFNKWDPEDVKIGLDK